MRAPNMEEEMQEKRARYRGSGVEEDWVADEDGEIRPFRKEEKEHSEVAPDPPPEVEG